MICLLLVTDNLSFIVGEPYASARVSAAIASQVRVSAILLLLIIRNYEVLLRGFI